MARRKAALQKEKEQLDLADTNALLHHPNQFSIANPASPGGPQSNRKTRHTRHRHEPEEFASVAEKNNKKRKAPVDYENGSPGPADRLANADGLRWNTSNSKLDTIASTTPVYTMDNLFKESELNAILRTATRAVIEASYSKRRKAMDENGSSLMTNADVTEDEDDLIEEGVGLDGPMEEAMLLVAPSMNRTANSSMHATRSTRNANLQDPKLNYSTLGDLAGRQAAIAMIGAYEKQPKSEADVVRTPSLTDQQAEDDMLLMQLAIEREKNASSPASRKLIEDLLPDRHDYISAAFDERNGHTVSEDGLSIRSRGSLLAAE